MSNNVKHFIGPLPPIRNILVKGYGGIVKVRSEITIKWKIEYDDIKYISSC